MEMEDLKNKKIKQANLWLLLSKTLKLLAYGIGLGCLIACVVLAVVSTAAMSMVTLAGGLVGFFAMYSFSLAANAKALVVADELKTNDETIINTFDKNRLYIKEKENEATNSQEYFTVDMPNETVNENFYTSKMAKDEKGNKYFKVDNDKKVNNDTETLEK